MHNHDRFTEKELKGVYEHPIGHEVPGLDSTRIAIEDALQTDYEAARSIADEKHAQHVSNRTTPRTSSSGQRESIITDDGRAPLSRSASKTPGVDVEAAIPEATIPGEGFPDGGRTAWLCVLGGWMTLFCAFGFMNAIGIFQAYYKAELLPGYSESTLSWISGMQLFFIFGGGTIAGTWFDTFGPTWLIRIGALLMPFGVFMISISTQYWQVFLAQAVVVGFGTCFAFYAAINSVSTWFFHKRAMAIGITSTGGSCGGIFYPIVMSKLVNKIGFGWTLRIMGFVILFCLGSACFLLKSRLDHAKTLKGRKIVFFDFQSFKDPAWACFAFGCFIQLFGLWSPINYLASFAIANGFSPGMAFNLIAIMNAGSFFGRLIPGILGDKLGRINMFTIFSTLSGILILGMWGTISTHVQVIAYAALYGCASGAFLSIYPACVAQLSDIKIIGQRMGTLNLMASLGSLGALPISGLLIRGSDFSRLIYFSGVMMLGGSLFLMGAKYYAGGRKWVKRV